MQQIIVEMLQNWDDVIIPLLNYNALVNILQTMDTLTSLQAQLEELESKKTNLETEVQHDPMKTEAVKLYEKLSEVVCCA